jgi:hypothetical protein
MPSAPSLPAIARRISKLLQPEVILTGSAEPFRAAVTQELQPPEQQRGHRRKPQFHGRERIKKRGRKVSRHAGAVPRFRHRRRVQTTIGKTGFEGHAFARFDDLDVFAPIQQRARSAQTDEPATYD